MTGTQPATGIRGTEGPFLARIAGLPADVVEVFASPLCREAAEVIVTLEAEIELSRGELVSHLHAAIPRALPELRRALLLMKRDAFNGRLLPRETARQAELEPIAGEPLSRVLSLESKLVAARESFAVLWHREESRQRAALLAVANDHRALKRGMALASPAFLDSIARLRHPGSGSESRRRKTETILLRYVTRAALKLSPNSTLTRLALGRLRGDLKPALALAAKPWDERSLLRLRRRYVETWCDLLERYPPWRDGLKAGLNETCTEIEPDRYRWLRPGRWEPRPEGRQLTYAADAWIRAPLSTERFLALRGALKNEPTFGALAILVGNVPTSELVRLLDLGLIQLRLPWRANESRVESRLAEFLSAHTEPRLQALAEPLGRLVALERAYPQTPTPERTLEELALLLSILDNGVSELAGVVLEPAAEIYRRGRFYEDVFLTSSPTAAELVEASSTAVEQAFASAEPMARLAYLYNHRHDFLLTLAEFVRRRAPSCTSFDLLDLYSSVRPLWQEFNRYIAAAFAGDEGWRSSFNPYGLPEMAELADWRLATWEAFDSCIERGHGEERISIPALTRLLDAVPERFAPLSGICLFLQPIDAKGDRWCLNRAHEGVGRYGSRFTSVMGDEGRAYTSRLAELSTIEVDGEVCELLDLLCAQGDTLNVHEVQTRRVLEIHGRPLDLAPERRVRLRDLRVEISGPRGLPWLMDQGGTLFLPVHLGGASHAFMPDLVKFLSYFGPGEFRSVWPVRHPRCAGDVEIFDRLVVGNLVVARRRWSCRLTDLLALLDRPDPEAFVALTSWRARHGIPERVFVGERIEHLVLGDRFKPQFLDLTSPLFLPILRGAIESSDGTVRFEEVLPSSHALPRDQEGRPWAVELMLDSAAFPERSRPDSDLSPGRTGVPRNVRPAIRQPEPLPAQY